MSDETNTPQAPDEWWKAAAASVDKPAAEKAAIAAEDFQAHRRWHYYNYGQEVGGWAGPSGMSRSNNYSRWPRTIRWA